jgi:hypothetical protein
MKNDDYAFLILLFMTIGIVIVFSLLISWQ